MRATPADLAAMRQAIALSAFGVGTTSPNPPVGCVILDAAGEVVGHGYHERKGESHAEVHALTMAGDRARGGTAVVTLEPCNHHGRTPPCRQALLDAGIARCVIAVLDPTSREEGGAARMQAAGVDVEVGVLADEAKLVLGPWLHAQATGRPFVTWVHAVDRRGQSSPLSGAVEQEHRRAADVVVAPDRTISEGVAGQHGNGMLDLGSVDAGVPPKELLRALYACGARLVLLNVGATIAESFLIAGLVDQIELYLEGQEHAPDALPLKAPWSAPYLSGMHLVDVRKYSDSAMSVTARAPAHNSPGHAPHRP